MPGNDPWSDFPNANHAPPIAPRQRPAASADPWAAFPDHEPAGAQNLTQAGTPTGQAHDGDTFRLSDGNNGRLYGVDAFELPQQGRDRSGQPVMLGDRARSFMVSSLSQGATPTFTGAKTYNRAVASLSVGAQDVGQGLLDRGLGVVTPQYLKADPIRLADYTQAERGANLNRRGAFDGTFQMPSDYRHGTGNATPWANAQPGTEGNSVAVFNDEATPFQGLRDDVAKGYLSVWQDMRSTPADLLAYAKANGIRIDPAETERQYAARAQSHKPGTDIGYRSPPRVLTDLHDGNFGAGLRGFADPFNLLDEVGGAVDSVLPNGIYAPGQERENIWSSPRRFGDILANNTEQNRAILGNDESQHGWARFGGQLASGLVVPGASLDGVGFSAARAAMRNGASRFLAEKAASKAVSARLGAAGSFEASAAGFGQGEDWSDRATGALLAAPLGYGLGVGTGFLAPKIAAAVGRPFNRLARRDGEASAQSFADGALDANTPGVRSSDPWSEFADVPMRSEFDPTTLEGPSFAAPRPVDRLDVNSGPRPLLDPATEMERRAAADRVQPADVLPQPFSGVDGMAEAERIVAGRYAPIKAPDETQELVSRSIPSAVTGTPINKRGPLDLVTWLRSNGGLKPETNKSGYNELTHYGIDNKPRAGMDFAGGEHRFGPLVDPVGGASYDDAAHAAWEAGFFPDHVERPSVDEFLDALNSTHSGRNRSFRNDDLPEIDAFNAARGQRHAVEGARFADAPMVEDRGQPIGQHDLDRNAPPVTAYEEWGDNAPNFAGNIRLDKLDSPQAIKRALVHTERVTGGFDAARRGRISQAETESLASELNMTADELLSRRKGQAFNAEQALASRQILARSGNDLVNMARRVQSMDNPGDEVLAQFRQAWVRHVAIQEQVAGATAEAGRALASFRMLADSRAAGRVLPELVDGAGGTKRLKEAADLILQGGDDPAAVNKAAQLAMRPRLKDKLVELWYNSLLSGPQTHAVNILGNTMTAISQLPEHAAADGVGAVRRLVPGQGDTDRVLFSEIGARAVGLLQGAREGFIQAARTMRTGEPADAASKVEAQAQRAISGIKGSIIRTPTRALSAEDELFKAMARRMEISGLAVRQADSEGLRGDAARQRIAELVANPTADMTEQAFDYGRYLTFQRPLDHDGISGSVSRLTQKHTVLKLILPFIRTPVNIMKFAAERSPAAPFMKEWRADVLAGGARRDLAVAKAMVGSGIMATVMQSAGQGDITGGGPADDSARALMRADGWQPYSVRIGGKYYSYARLDPFSTTLGVAADFAELQSHMTDKQRSNVAMMLAASTIKNLSNKVWFSGVSDLSNAITDSERYGGSFVKRLAGSMLVPGSVAQVARTVDPTLRETRGTLDAIRARIPGMSSSLFPKRDVWGAEIKREGGLGPDIMSPVFTSTARNDAVNSALLSAGAHIGTLSRKLAGRDLTDAEYDSYQARSGMLAHQTLADLVSTSRWVGMSSEDRAEFAETIVKNARKTVRRGLFGSSRTAPSATAPSANDAWAAYPDAH